MKKFIFILSPPFQGSTILLNLISSSINVTSFLKNRFTLNKGLHEGQFLMSEIDKNFFKNRWDPNYKVNMKDVKNLYDKYWNKSKDIFLEKSPSTICRAEMFQEYFSKFGKVYFIILIRNPYSTNWHVDEYGYDTDWITCAKYQKKNLENLKNKILIKYEDLCLNTNYVIKKLNNFIPELGNLKIKYNNFNLIEKYHKIHTNKVDRILGVNWKNYFLKNDKEIVEYFDYNILDEEKIGCYWKEENIEKIYWSNSFYDIKKDISFDSVDEYNSHKEKNKNKKSFIYKIKIVDKNRKILFTQDYNGQYWKLENDNSIYWSNNKTFDKDIKFDSIDDYMFHRVNNGFNANWSDIQNKKN